MKARIHVSMLTLKKLTTTIDQEGSSRICQKSNLVCLHNSATTLYGLADLDLDTGIVWTYGSADCLAQGTRFV